MFGAFYRRKAERCERMAKKATDPEERAQYLELENLCLSIAVQLDSYGDKSLRMLIRPPDKPKVM